MDDYIKIVCKIKLAMFYKTKKNNINVELCLIKLAMFYKTKKNNINVELCLIGTLIAMLNYVHTYKLMIL